MFAQMLQELALAAKYLPLLLELASEEQTINALKPGDSVPINPLVFGKYSLEGGSAGGIQIRRLS